jgi:hypothetical protein
VFSIISQRNAWTRLKISSEMFMMLCHFYRVFPKFLECVFRFSVKTCKTEEYFSGGCYRLVHGGEKLENATRSTTFRMFEVNYYRYSIPDYITEISYNIRHFQRDRSDLQDPWSSYQCSVYHNYSHLSDASTWILIHIPKETRCHLERLNSDAGDSPQSDHPMGMHLHLLLSCETNWGPYIGYLGEELSLLVGSLAHVPKRCNRGQNILEQ